MVDDPLQLKLVVVLQQEAGGTQNDNSLTGHLRRVLHHFLKFPQVGAREYFSLARNRRRFIQKVVPIGNRDRRWQARPGGGARPPALSCDSDSWICFGSEVKSESIFAEVKMATRSVGWRWAA